jgi:endonuclease/exonuclease/phosphatase family metal-dependent hydrolase
MTRIGTWNLENLARPAGPAAGLDDHRAYEEKLDTLAATITELHPDVLAIQEVLDPNALDDLISRLDGFWRSELADPDGRGIRVGVLSRAALTNVQQIRDFPDGLLPVQADDDGATIGQLGRPGMQARVRTGGRTIEVISVHLKSKLLTFPGGRFSPRDEGERTRYAVYALHRRAAEAAGIRSHVSALLSEDPQAAVVVAGDLNDEPQAATTQILHGPPGSEIGTAGFDQPDAGDSQRMWNTAAFIAEQERWSRVYRGRRELIDHVLCSHALIGAVRTATTGGLPVESIEDRPETRRNATASDHRPVLVDITDA